METSETSETVLRWCVGTPLPACPTCGKTVTGYERPLPPIRLPLDRLDPPGALLLQPCEHPVNRLDIVT